MDFCCVAIAREHRLPPYFASRGMDASWGKFYQQLATFQQENGHCQVHAVPRSEMCSKFNDSNHVTFSRVWTEF